MHSVAETMVTMEKAANPLFDIVRPNVNTLIESVDAMDIDG